jgi:hypothetical protein
VSDTVTESTSVAFLFTFANLWIDYKIGEYNRNERIQIQPGVIDCRATQGGNIYLDPAYYEEEIEY